MRWDDELEALARQVHETFGEDAVAKAYIRVLLQAPTSSESTAAAVDLLGESMQPAGGSIKFTDGAQSATMLKHELRRMLRPH